MIYSPKTTQNLRNISCIERQKLKKLRAKKQTQWMIEGIIK